MKKDTVKNSKPGDKKKIRVKKGAKKAPETVGRDPERTRAMILDAAKSLIAEEGSDSVSVSKVARLAGVNRGTAYLHFKDRDELLAETIESVRQELTDIIRTASKNMENWSVDDVFAMERIALTLANNARLARIWLAELVLGGDAKDDSLWDVWRGGLQSMQKAGYFVDDVDEEVLVIMGLCTSFVWPVVTGADKMSKNQRTRSAKRFAHAFHQIVINGVLKR